MAQRFVDELMEGIASRCPSMSRKEARDIEEWIRLRWGGSREYIDRATAAKKLEKLAAELAKGTPIKEAVKTAGLSRRTGYRVLSRKWLVRDY